MIDTHCHIFKEYYENIDSIVNNMDGYMIVAGCDDSTNLEVIDLVNKYDNVYGVIGIQPEEVSKISSSSYKIIEDNISNPKIVGIGEIGLDYYWDDSNKEEQIKVFKDMLSMARKYNKAVVVHSRDAIQDTYDILKDYKDLKIDLHCYSGSLEMAKRFLDLGIKFGIGGVLTFKNSKTIKEVVEHLPMESVLLETDSPYLSPEPLRGKQNIPNNIKIVAEKIAEIKGLSTEKILEITTKNAISQFDLNI